MAWVRPRGVTVAVVGPDGAGKTTVSSAVVAALPVTARAQYMGLYQATAGRARVRRSMPRLLLTQVSRGIRARRRQAAGEVVVFDRFPVDARLPSAHPLSRRTRLRRWLLARSCPRPDLCLLLDAPGAALSARAPWAGDAETCEAQRRRYLALLDRHPQMTRLDATRSVESLASEIVERVLRLYDVRRPGTRHLPQTGTVRRRTVRS